MDSRRYAGPRVRFLYAQRLPSILDIALLQEWGWISATDSESQQIVNDGANTSEVTDELLPLDAIEAVYPKLGTYREESLSIWETFSEEKKHKAIDFVQTYISQTPNAIDQMYLNRYLKAELWEK